MRGFCMDRGTEFSVVTLLTSLSVCNCLSLSEVQAQVLSVVCQMSTSIQSTEGCGNFGGLNIFVLAK